jgi:nicotinamidase/pyrazinamidase
MAMNVQVVIIDPQGDFMDDPDSALGVPGANDDMNRTGAMIDRLGSRIDDIHVTFDSHHQLDIGHQAMWVGADGRTPPPVFTAISVDDIRTGIWTPRFGTAKPPALEGLTIREYMLRYASTLEEQGQYQLMVWPTHCLMGSPKHAAHGELFKALNRWSGGNFANIDWVVKGVSPWTEHYGALKAEVPLPSDPSTGLNTRLLEMLSMADMVVIAGEALSHCLRTTVTQIVDNIDPNLIKKLYLATDCTSPIPKVGDGPNFPALAAKWQDEMVARGMNLTTSTEFLA